MPSGIYDRSKSKPKSKKQFCIHGHNISIVGRNKFGNCNQCCLIRQRIDPTKNSSIKPICPQGHDKSVVGRDKDGKCTLCRKRRDSIRKKKAHIVNPERCNRRTKEWKEAHPEETKLMERKTKIKKNYGLTWEAYQEWIRKQNNKCAICQIEFIGGNYIPCIDHDHKTKIIRGILCKTCNSALGHLKDDIVLFERAIEYLKKFQ